MGVEDEPLHIFVSYAHEDKRWLDAADEHNLIPWLEHAFSRHQPPVAMWYDRHERAGLHAGEEFDETIRNEVDRAQVVLLLVSWAFLNSDYIQDVELPRILGRVERREAQLIPILLEPCPWKERDYLKSRQLLPGEPKPLIDYTTSDPAWLRVRNDIATEVGRALKIAYGALQPEASLPPTPTPKRQPIPVTGPPDSTPTPTRHGVWSRRPSGWGAKLGWGAAVMLIAGVIVAVVLGVSGKPSHQSTALTGLPSTLATSQSTTVPSPDASSASQSDPTSASTGEDGSYSSSGAKIAETNGTKVEVTKLGLRHMGSFGPEVSPTLSFLDGSSIPFDDIRTISLAYDSTKPCKDHMDITATVTLKIGATRQGLLDSICSYPDYWNVGVLTGPVVNQGGSFDLEIQKVGRVEFLP